MDRKNTIVVMLDFEPVTSYGSIVQVCKDYKLPYWKLKSMKFPIHQGRISLYKVPFRKKIEYEKNKR